MSPTTIINKIWNFAGVLRDDGVSYGDYLEQITYLLFLKMADEYSKPPYNRKVNIPNGYGWEDLKVLRGAELENLPEPDVLAQEIVEEIEAALAGLLVCDCKINPLLTFIRYH